MIVGLIVVVAVNAILLSLSIRQRQPSFGISRLAVSVVAPFQRVVTNSIRTTRDFWHHYFHLVDVSHENDFLRKQLDEALEDSHRKREIELANNRLRDLLNFQKSMGQQVLPAEVIGKDPSPWYKTIVIDKGSRQGVMKGMPVVVPQGIVGQVMETGPRYAKVLLIIDQNNAVDALVQKSRARGIVTGGLSGNCRFKYVLRKYEVNVGDKLISSGLDGVFPKGLRVGYISSVIRKSSGIFQEVTVAPFVDFEKLEEVLVVISHGASGRKPGAP